MGEDRFSSYAVNPAPQARDFFVHQLSKDEKYMSEAVRQAVKGIGRTSPNPAVGCVIVKGDKVIARSYHHRAGMAHAEPLALARAGRAAAGATMYVTLEPCNFFGRTPPCTKAIIESGIKKVIVGTIDPNPKVNSRGIAELKRAGIETSVGVFEAKCKEIIKPYAKFITTGLPYVTVKYAQSLDGRIATSSGSSRWISSAESLKFAHRLRALNDAVLVGAGTANTDDPLLTVRHVRGRNPVRVILSGSGKLRKDLKILRSKEARTIIATSSDRKFPAGMEILRFSSGPKGIDMLSLLRKLAELGITSLLVEGGAKVITGFLNARLVDRLIAVTCPIIIGEGTSAIGMLGVKTIGDSMKLKNAAFKKLGKDIAIMGDLR